MKPRIDETMHDRKGLLIVLGLSDLSSEVPIELASQKFWTEILPLLYNRRRIDDIIKLLNHAKDVGFGKGESIIRTEYDDIISEWEVIRENPMDLSRFITSAPYLKIDFQKAENDDNDQSQLSFTLSSNIDSVPTGPGEVLKGNFDFYNELAGGIRFYPVSEHWRKSAQLLGTELYKLLTKNETMKNALTIARNEAGGTGRLHIIFSGRKNKLKIPWELLYDPDAEDYLANLYPLSRAVIADSYPRYIKPLTEKDREKPNILLIKSNAKGQIKDLGLCLCKLRYLDKEVERLARLFESFAKKPCVIKEASLDQLDSREILDTKWDIVHYVGQMRYDSVMSGLFFKEKDRPPYFFDKGQIVNLLRKFKQTPKFVYLSCGEGAQYGGKTASEFLYSDSVGIMQCLVDAGVPSFLGFRWRVNYSAALEFSTKFYEYFFDGHSHTGSAGRGSLREAFFLAKQEIMSGKMYHNHNICISPVLSVFGDQIGITS